MLMVWLGITFMAGFARDPIPVALEQLAKDPSGFHGKVLRIDAIVVASEEASIIRLQQGSQDAEGLAVLVVLSPALARKPDRMAREFGKLLRKRGKAEASLEGRLEVAAHPTWGHQLCCRIRLEVAKVRSVRIGR